MRVSLSSACLLLAASLASACDKPQQFTTTVELLQVRRVGQSTGPGRIDLELRYVDCPGDARLNIRGDQDFAGCAKGIKKGDKLKADVVRTYSSERGTFRSTLVKLGDCPIKIDTKDEANYETFQECEELKASGAVVGVHCNRRREGALLQKCPWMRRR